METDSKRICSKNLPAPEISLTGLWFPPDILLALLKGDHNMNLFPVLCDLSSSPHVSAVPQGHQPGLSTVLNESSLDPWI